MSEHMTTIDYERFSGRRY